MTVAVLEGALLDGVIERLTRPDYRAFEAQLRSSGYCSRPVRLQGGVEVCDGHGGRRQVWSTDGEPDGLLRKACGNRREAVCGPCAKRYRGDAWQLIAAGLRGGKGIPESVMGHPAVFATLTASSFGVVHAHVLGADGEPVRCRPRRDRPICRHGIPLSCSRVHAPDDPCLGEPLCPDCFDYSGAVIWNNLLGELWRRTMIYLPRRLAALVGMTQKRLHEQVRVSYVKVAEYQHRGLVHLHPVIRVRERPWRIQEAIIMTPVKIALKKTMVITGSRRMAATRTANISTALTRLTRYEPGCIRNAVIHGVMATQAMVVAPTSIVQQGRDSVWFRRARGAAGPVGW